MAYDERFANGFISSSGQAGAKLHRRKYGETIQNIAATNEYHWMAGNYLEVRRRLGLLPVDSHELIAMVAPRPVFLGAGKGPALNPDGIDQDDGPERSGVPARAGRAPRRRPRSTTRGSTRRARSSPASAQVRSTAARQEGPRHDRVSRPAKPTLTTRRHRLPPALGRSHAGSELGLLPRFRFQVLGPETCRAMRIGCIYPFTLSFRKEPCRCLGLPGASSSR